MRYENITPAVFLRRLNRFTALVSLGGREETVHVKNTGRLGELLLPGAEVFLTAPASPGRKTKYDLVSLRTKEGAVFNIDSQAPNKAARAWLETCGFDRVRPEYAYGASRIDFYMEKENARFLMEVKGCTLVKDGVGYFPDAPTERGIRHIRELIRAAGEGMHAVLAFVIQTEGVFEVRPNLSAQPAFGAALEAARAAGVRILYLPCAVSPERLSIREGTMFQSK